MATTARPIWRVPTNSSAIVSHGYDPDQRILAVEFSSGKVYHHHDVPPDVVDRFNAAGSRGKAYADEVRGKFSTAAVDAPLLAECPKCGDKGLATYQCRDCGTADYGQL